MVWYGMHTIPYHMVWYGTIPYPQSGQPVFHLSQPQI